MARLPSSPNSPTSAPQPLATTAAALQSYGYDAVGNRVSSSLGAYSVNRSNQVTAAGANSYTYDGNGNLLTKTTAAGTTAYGWDYENRLVSVSAPGSSGSASTVSFAYDPLGRRIRKTTAAGSTLFVYDRSVIVGTVDATSGAITSTIAQGPGIDAPLALNDGQGTYYYRQDGLGSVTSLSGTAGQTVASYVYDAFGNTLTSTGNVVNAYRFTGREWDSETSLYYYRARYYDPTIGRFISEDPLGFAGSGSNFHAYVGNSPVNNIDPFGLTLVKSKVPFPGASGRDQNGLYTMNVNDGSTLVTDLTLLTEGDVLAQEQALARELEGKKKGWRNCIKNRRDETVFDTAWFNGTGPSRTYYYVQGMNQIYADNEINYIGIGMYEAWLGDSFSTAEALTYVWKAHYKKRPSSGTLYWLQRGYDDYGGGEDAF